MTKLHDLLKPVINSKETNLNENKKHGITIWLWLTCLLFIISMIACSPTTSSDSGSKTFSYPSATFGTAETISPVNTPSQVASYTLITSHAVGIIDPPTIDAMTGVITTTATTTAGIYSVTIYDDSNTMITTSSFTVTYIAKTKADLEREIKGLNATGRFAWGHTGNFNYINTSAVTDMSSLFGFNHISGQKDSTFNGDISKWDVSGVKNMRNMFQLATAFNQDLSNWNVSSVTTMQNMFNNATAFNQDISGWDISSVTSMQHMFVLATTFNQNLESWEVDPSVIVTNMFDNSGVDPLPTWCTTDRGC